MLSVVTGANRGIGLALVTLLKERGDDVVGTCRGDASSLRALGVEAVSGVDIGTPEGVKTLTDAIGSRTIGLLINNAGILRWCDTLEAPSFDEIEEQFRVNAMGALRVTSALRKNFERGSKIAIVTSRMGSIGDNSSGGMYGYRMSKAALNMVGKSMAEDLREAGIAVAILHPGMVKTDMVGMHGQVEPLDAARGLLERIDGLTLETTGSFWHARGEVLPW